jgi:hypothetical protein
VFYPVESEAYQNALKADSRREPSYEAKAGRHAWLQTTAAFELDINYRQLGGEHELIDLLRTGRVGKAPTQAQLWVRKRFASNLPLFCVESYVVANSKVPDFNP